MTKNPILNALAAFAYIVLIASVMNFVTQNLGDKPDTAFAPVAFLSLLTLSAAVMAYLFFYQPLQLFIESKKKEGIDLFLRTVLIFAIFTALVFSLLFSGTLSF